MSNNRYPKEMKEAIVAKEIKNEPIPKVGDYSIILDSKDNAVCIVRTSKITICPFKDVTAEHAYKEGEGDMIHNEVE